MRAPENPFKRGLQARDRLIGLWVSSADPFMTEVVAGAGFDWLLLDTEHSHASARDVLGQLQAASAYPTSAVVRPASNDPVVIKQLLDLGAQSLLIPQVDDAAQARAAVAAVHYPPQGIRGVSATTRATRFGRVSGYAGSASSEICLTVQVESAHALEELDEILDVDGVDGVFVGPGDLAASLGHVGDPRHPDVAAVVEDALRRIGAAGRPAGVLTSDRADAGRWLDLGAVFVAVGVDTALLARAADSLAAAFDRPAPAPSSTAKVVHHDVR
ncbi:HpcH/HpaI aldolase/citrate lyase family protein [Mycolicibacterium sp. CBMA 226]|uniref:HpcH/HpaI aldolase family protein n=1 Tax=Mycolicibacterium sp. CBMA 226 TaxID=2606611 RepID=UPI0013096ABC|nr:HpcH/HpaI aldolase/citrate lyase family protein [Mycolicibacterium sp. CBMA 226]MUL78996.1 HpcH/HpaI aldolase/citrate lyase family protein [Mycolicibacterium sp. CBMA 226]QGW61312.1 4-hydroxy-2-oxo-heptane-1,7-dioate aldolase [Mycolicibacterium sp.]